MALPATEAYLAEAGEGLDPEALRRAVRQDIDGLDVTGDGAAGEDYRRHIAGVVTRRAVTAAWRASGREAGA